MEELNYEKLFHEIEKKLRSEKSMILATCADDKVTARMVSHINDGLTVLFSTNRNSQKAEQMRRNANIALAIDNMNIEAAAELFGHPGGHVFFQRAYPKKFPLFAKLYPDTPEDMLVIARPVKITLFKYSKGACWDVLETDGKKAYRLT